MKAAASWAHPMAAAAGPTASAGVQVADIEVPGVGWLHLDCRNSESRLEGEDRQGYTDSEGHSHRRVWSSLLAIRLMTQTFASSLKPCPTVPASVRCGDPASTGAKHATSSRAHVSRFSRHGYIDVHQGVDGQHAGVPAFYGCVGTSIGWLTRVGSVFTSPWHGDDHLWTVRPSVSRSGTGWSLGDSNP